jgi:predicted dehydrogenase
MYFAWLSGDHVVEQHMHQIDVANWVMGIPPRLAIGMGGRQVRIQPEYGHIFDHFATDFFYKTEGGYDDVRIASYARQIDGTYGKMDELFIGTEGTALASGRIKGKNAWVYKGERPNPYVQEHADHLAGIRAGKPLNEGKQCAESTLSAIMARMSAYTGQAVTWDFVLNKSKLDLFPKNLDLKGSMPEPLVAMPGSPDNKLI